MHRNNHKSAVYPVRDMWLLMPGLFGFLLFYLVPLLMMPGYAVTKNAMNHTFVGMANFLRVWKNNYFWLALKNTFVFAGFAVPLSLCAALLLALLLQRLRNDCYSVFMVPYFLPTASVCSVFAAFLPAGSISGVFVSGIEQWLTILVFYLWKYTGIQMMILIGGLSRIPKEVEEAAAMDGANALQRLVYMRLPLLRPTLVFCILFSLSSCMRIYRESYSLYGQYPAKTVYQLQHYLYNHFTKLNYQYLSAAALSFLALYFLVAALPVWLENRWSREMNRE